MFLYLIGMIYNNKASQKDAKGLECLAPKNIIYLAREYKKMIDSD
jgi:hypothetical protein